MKITVLTYTQCSSEKRIPSMGSCMYDQQYANSIGIQPIHNSNTHATNNYAVTISCVQNACLEYVEMLGAFQNFENYISPPFPIFKIF